MATAGVSMSRVLIGEFNPVMRLGLRDLLTEAGCEVVAEDINDDYDLVDRLSYTLPDVLLLDLDDEELARAVSVAYPGIKVIACAPSGESMRIFPRFHHGESFLTTMSVEFLIDASSAP
jgi:DNA-binding NarL/FixJ family response regulator